MRTNYIFSETRLTRRAVALASGLAMMFVLLLLFGLQTATKPANAATTGLTFTVNSTGDDNDLDFPGGTFDGSSDGKCFTGDFLVIGEKCTLRAAIQAANESPGADTIDFGIPTIGVATISPGSELPEITRPVTIDGYTQGEARENTESQPGKTNAVLKIQLVGGHAGLFLNAGASNSVIRGLVIGFCLNSPCDNGISLSGGTGYRVEGNFLGIQANGTSNLGNIRGVFLDRTSGSTIGGASPAARNLISGNVFEGVLLSNGSSGNTIEGNLIGTDKDGNPLGNGGSGVELIFAGNGNRILSNSVFSNNGPGIDLSTTNAADGVTANDPKDPDTGPNRLQNYPEITSAFTTLAGTSISGKLYSTPSTKLAKRTFIIQFFSSPAEDPSHFGEGKTFLGQIQKTTGTQGNASFTFAPFKKVSEGQFITATATNQATGDTSEFSRARLVKPPVVQP